MCTPRLVNVDFILKQKVRLQPFSGFGAMKFAENKIQNIHNFVILDHSQKKIKSGCIKEIHFPCFYVHVENFV